MGRSGLALCSTTAKAVCTLRAEMVTRGRRDPDGALCSLRSSCSIFQRFERTLVLSVRTARL